MHQCNATAWDVLSGVASGTASDTGPVSIFHNLLNANVDDPDGLRRDISQLQHANAKLQAQVRLGLSRVSEISLADSSEHDSPSMHRASSSSHSVVGTQALAAAQNQRLNAFTLLCSEERACLDAARLADDAEIRLAKARADLDAITVMDLQKQTWPGETACGNSASGQPEFVDHETETEILRRKLAEARGAHQTKSSDLRTCEERVEQHRLEFTELQLRKESEIRAHGTLSNEATAATVALQTNTGRLWNAQIALGDVRHAQADQRKVDMELWDVRKKNRYLASDAESKQLEFQVHEEIADALKIAIREGRSKVCHGKYAINELSLMLNRSVASQELDLMVRTEEIRKLEAHCEHLREESNEDGESLGNLPGVEQHQDIYRMDNPQTPCAGGQEFWRLFDNRQRILSQEVIVEQMRSTTLLSEMDASRSSPSLECSTRKHDTEKKRAERRPNSHGTRQRVQQDPHHGRKQENSPGWRRPRHRLAKEVEVLYAWRNEAESSVSLLSAALEQAQGRYEQQCKYGEVLESAIAELSKVFPTSEVGSEAVRGESAQDVSVPASSSRASSRKSSRGQVSRRTSPQDQRIRRRAFGNRQVLAASIGNV